MATELRSGDQIDTRTGALVVVSSRFEVGPQEVYNLSVASDATYFVGAGEAVVHNGKWKDKVHDAATIVFMACQLFGGDPGSQIKIPKRPPKPPAIELPMPKRGPKPKNERK